MTDQVRLAYAQAAQALVTSLQLDNPPVAVAFTEGPPPHVPALEREGPSACSFWRWAETRVFYAPAAAHFNCAVGAMVMGFELPTATQQELMGRVEQMVACGYLGGTEAANIPAIPDKHAGIVYGPLSQFPVQPDVVLLWLTPRQAMVYAEAAGTCAWTESVPVTTALGRPACAVLPMALRRGEASLSLGCTGMRTFTDISQDHLLAAVPGARLADFIASLERTLGANAAMQEFYDGRKALFAPVTSSG